ncbi:MAG: hypothetical protein JWQ62_1671 [Lacunisphaera sp.]|nr:hypothetical protein [Lacunisphaera sp.]
MRFLPNLNLRSSVAAQFAPSDRFFMRFVPLAPDLPPLAQAELALEGLAPFPPAQLYWGCCVSPDRTSALVYAAHRRRFTAEETAGWERADVVVPDLLPLIGAASTGAGVLVQSANSHLGGAAWSGRAPWPVAVHTRAFPETPGEENRRQFASELAAKAKLANAPVKSVAGTPSARREGDKLIFELKDSAGTVIAATAVARADQDTLDVRDRALLYKRQRDRNRGEFIWRLLLVGGAVGVASLLLDLGALTFRLIDRAQQSRVAAQAPLVQKLQTAQALTSRIDELTHRRLRFFEMLSTVNDARPKSIQFTRTGTSGRNALEIEAQTSSADDVGAFESALNKLATLEKVEVKDLRAREGVTTFGITIAFKADAKPDASPATSGGAP